jgi:hypothetical protein
MYSKETIGSSYMDSVIYEDSPYSNIRQKGAMAIAMLPFIVIILFCLLTGNMIGLIGGFVAGLLISFYHLMLFPRKYQIFNNKLRILLGDVFPFDIPFDNLEIAGQPTRKQWFLGTSLGFGIYSDEHAVQIVQKKSRLLPRINISPCAREKFLEQLNKAQNDWRTKNSQEH